MSELYEKIYAAVQKIPKGKVATYAQVAAMAGNPRMCRVVGNALHQNPYYGIVPCHRVVNSKGVLQKHLSSAEKTFRQRCSVPKGWRFWTAE